MVFYGLISSAQGFLIFLSLQAPSEFWDKEVGATTKWLEQEVETNIQINKKKGIRSINTYREEMPKCKNNMQAEDNEELCVFV